MKLIEKNNKKGITLIALVITIIVLLILAGVSIAMLTGDNSLLGNAQKTGPANNIGAAKDEVGLAYNTAMQEYYETKYASTNGTNGTFATKLETAINEITSKGKNHGCGIVYDKDAGKITITNGGYKVIGTVDTADDSAGISWGEMKETTGIDLDKVTLKLNIADDSTKTGTLTATLSRISGDITWTSSSDSIATVSGSNKTATIEAKAEGTATITASCTANGKTYSSTCTVEVINKTKSLPGSTLSATSSACKEISVANLVYADLDGDATTAEGIIFADKDGNAVTAATAATAATSGYTMKDYVGETKTSSGKIISKTTATTTATTDNYYVLALADVDANVHCWYYSAYNSGISDYNSVTSTDFGKGSTNTSTMIEKWNKPEYGAKNGNKSYPDMWEIIQNVQDEGWFVPSKDEWKKVFDNLGVKSSNYGKYGLNDWYWASSLTNTSEAWCVYFNTGYRGRLRHQWQRLCALGFDFLSM